MSSNSTAAASNAGAAKLLANAFRKVKNEPTEGFTCELPDDANLFEWDVYIEGPKGTMFENGIFKLCIKFPDTYPMSPPELHFVSEFWHPNVYKDGKVCLSILHPPGFVFFLSFFLIFPFVFCSILLLFCLPLIFFFFWFAFDPFGRFFLSFLCSF